MGIKSVLFFKKNNEYIPNMTIDILNELRDRNRPSVLFCGAGLSIGSVPGAVELYEQECLLAEKTLDLDGIIRREDYECYNKELRLYAWADDVIDELEKRGVSLPKLRLAEALGLLTDPRWWGEAEVDFRGNTPRHRVIARFAKEGLWDSIWSFNWDCILENAFEQIGLAEGTPSQNSPWKKNHYVTHVDSEYLKGSIHPDALNIRKPHGCVRAIKEAHNVERSDFGKADKLSYRLMIGEQELKDRKGCKKAALGGDNHFFVALEAGIKNRLNIILGWSMGEFSLKKIICKSLKPLEDTTLAILDPVFGQNHQDLCGVANLKKDDIYFKLETRGPPSRDSIFIYQQTFYAIESLELENGGIPITDKDGASWKTSISHESNSFIDAWADEFLPAWTRLCWSSGIVKAINLRSHEIDLERRDEYIPLNYSHVERKDLKSAIIILNSFSNLGTEYDTKTYPGGFFHESSRSLVIPLPCWSGFNELRALRPLIDSLRGKFGFIEKLFVWPIKIGEPCGNNCNEKQCELGRDLKISLSSFMPIPEFADYQSIHLISNLEEVA